MFCEECGHSITINKRTEEIAFSVLKKEIKFLDFEEEYEHKTKYTAGKASYIERNTAMIDNSDYCIFYYDENISKNYKSGTKIAYDYAKRKNKTIINLYMADNLCGHRFLHLFVVEFFVCKHIEIACTC